jgi:AcrR family transcriptional regulator
MEMQTEFRRRPYRMKARADSAAATAERILDAAVGLFWERPSVDISLDEVARRAGVSAQTVIRRFGGKDGLLVAGMEREANRIGMQRNRAVRGDLMGAVSALIEHYEELGDRVMKMLAEEQRSPALTAIVDHGRELHRAWCARTFAKALDGRTGVARERLLAQLVAVCDVYTWKLLRRDSGLSRQQTELAVRELVTRLVGRA